MKKFKHKTKDITLTKCKNGNSYYSENFEGYYIPSDFIEDSCDWEEIIEKDYEILSFFNESNREIYSHRRGNSIFNSEGLSGYSDVGERNYNYCLEFYKIHSVKRLSDGEVFTLKDRFTYDSCGGRIDKFNIIWGEVLIGDCKFPLNDIKKVKQPLFIAEDGIEIFMGDTVWHTNLNTFREPYSSIVEYTEPFTAVKGLFAKKENAEKYIKINKPQYSIKDIVLAVNNWAMSPCIDENDILNFLAKNENTKN